MAKRTNHLKLAELTPTKQLKKLPKLPKGKCGKRNKGCSIIRGGCGYRFKAGDKTWVCPKCGLDRRCRSNRVTKTRACRMHGAGGDNGGRPPKQAYAILSNLGPNYNEILRSKDLLDNSNQIAALDVIVNKLVEEMHQYDAGAAVDDMMKAYTMIANAQRYGNTSRIRAGLDMLLEAMAPLRTSQQVRDEIYTNYTLRNRMVDNQRKWALENKQMVPWIQVVEIVGVFQQLMFQYLPSGSDRSSFLKALKARFGNVIPRNNGDAS